jgi:hypothetical protein
MSRGEAVFRDATAEEAEELERNTAAAGDSSNREGLERDLAGVETELAALGNAPVTGRGTYSRAVTGSPDAVLPAQSPAYQPGAAYESGSACGRLRLDDGRTQ